jgi:hypothetical protein
VQISFLNQILDSRKPSNSEIPDTEKLDEREGKISVKEAMVLLDDESQENPQWSVVYWISAGGVQIAMGGNYAEVHQLKLKTRHLTRRGSSYP